MSNSQKYRCTIKIVKIKLEMLEFGFLKQQLLLNLSLKKTDELIKFVSCV